MQYLIRINQKNLNNGAYYPVFESEGTPFPFFFIQREHRSEHFDVCVYDIMNDSPPCEITDQLAHKTAFQLCFY